MSTDFGTYHVPCNMTLGDIMKSFGATNADAKKNRITKGLGATNADAKNRVTEGLGATNADAKKNRITEVNPTSVLVGNRQRDASVPLAPMGVSSQH
ncbi:class I glutamine amidotransferase-like protein [Apiospora arundinis]